MRQDYLGSSKFLAYCPNSQSALWFMIAHSPLFAALPESLMEEDCNANQAGNPLAVSNISVQENMRGKAVKEEAHQFSHLY